MNEYTGNSVADDDGSGVFSPYYNGPYYDEEIFCKECGLPIYPSEKTMGMGNFHEQCFMEPNSDEL